MINQVVLVDAYGLSDRSVRSARTEVTEQGGLLLLTCQGAERKRTRMPLGCIER